MSEKFKLAPNPTTGLLKVSGDELVDATISVYNWIGVFVKSVKSSSDNLSLDLSDCSTGVYTIIVRSTTGQWTRKVVKE